MKGKVCVGYFMSDETSLYVGSNTSGIPANQINAELVRDARPGNMNAAVEIKNDPKNHEYVAAVFKCPAPEKLKGSLEDALKFIDKQLLGSVDLKAAIEAERNLEANVKKTNLPVHQPTADQIADQCDLNYRAARNKNSTQVASR
jgi:hypothetical protein